MSFDVVVDAMKNDPELTKKVLAANTPAERAAVLDAHGVPRPTPDAQLPDMISTAGGHESTTTEVCQGAAATGAAAD